MIITKMVKVKIIGKTLKYFRDLNYHSNVGDILEIPIAQLNRKSIIKIDVRCDICGFEKLLPYQKYTKSTDNYGYYACSQKCGVSKCKKTYISIYGVDSQMKDNVVKNKVKVTKLIKYGDENYNNHKKSMDTKLTKYGDMNYNNIIGIKNTTLNTYCVDNIMKLDYVVDKMKNTKILKGVNLPDTLLSEFKLYKRNVLRITRRNKKKLFEEWDGLDHYDNEYIKGNLSLSPINRTYPTIDHKMSTFNGFINKIDYNIIGSLDNLCITKKYLNSIKGKNTKYNDFIS